MSGHENSGLECDERVQRADPGTAVGIAHKGHAAAKDQVAGIQHAVFLHDHGHIFAGVGGAYIAQHEMHAAHFKIGVACQEAVGFEQTGLVVHPGKQGFLALGQSVGRAFAAGLAFGHPVRPDFRAQRLEHLQAVEMVGMIVTDDHALDRLFGDLADFGHQSFGQWRRGQRVEHHHAILRDDKAGIGHEALVHAGSRTRQALHEIAVLAEFDGLHGHGNGAGGVSRVGKRQPAGQDNNKKQACEHGHLR